MSPPFDLIASDFNMAMFLHPSIRPLNAACILRKANRSCPFVPLTLIHWAANTAESKSISYLPTGDLRAIFSAILRNRALSEIAFEVRNLQAVLFRSFRKLWSIRSNMAEARIWIWCALIFRPLLKGRPAQSFCQGYIQKRFLINPFLFLVLAKGDDALGILTVSKFVIASCIPILGKEVLPREVKSETGKLASLKVFRNQRFRWQISPSWHSLLSIEMQINEVVAARQNSIVPVICCLELVSLSVTNENSLLARRKRTDNVRRKDMVDA